MNKNWNAVDETCPTCQQVTKRVRGITKQNLKRLIKPKWDSTEIVFTIILLMLFLISFLYKSETQQCRDWLEPMYAAKNRAGCEYVCDSRCSLINFTNQELNQTNLSNFSFFLDLNIST
jgi:4-hydroxy-3-methylbut-2-enyl diphosphate reductase IspH